MTTNKKISELNSATTPLDGTELVPLVQSGETKSVTAQEIANLGGGGGSPALESKESSTLHVSKDGSDATTTGSIEKPFLTIQAAHDHAVANFSPNDHVVIKVSSGRYTENLLITRARTHIVSERTVPETVTIAGHVVVNPSATVGGVYNSEISIHGALIQPSSNEPCVKVTGTNALTFDLKDCNLYGDNGNKGIVCDNSAAGGNRINIKDVNVNVNTGVGNTGMEVSNSFYLYVEHVNVYCNGHAPLVLSDTTATFVNTQLSCSHSDTVLLQSGSLAIGTSTITNSLSGGNGISVSPGATCVVSQCFFNVAAGAGYAVEGSLGSVVIHALNAFLPATNTKLNPAIGAGSIAMATSFT